MGIRVAGSDIDRGTYTPPGRPMKKTMTRKRYVIRCTNCGKQIEIKHDNPTNIPNCPYCKCPGKVEESEEDAKKKTFNGPNAYRV